MPQKNYVYPGTIEIEAFKAGKHTDSSGNSKTWTDSDIQAIADTYNATVSETNPDRREAPVVVGHPKDNSPAFGWIQSAKKVKDKLVLTLANLNDDFVKALKEGSYKYRSISLFPDNTIRHIGFLGGAQPAVPGLGPINWSTTEGDYITFEFSATESPVSVNSSQSLAELEQENNFFKRLFKKFGIDLANQFNQDTQFKGDSNDTDNMEDKGMAEKKDDMSKQISDLNDKIAERDKTIAELNSKIEESNSEARKAEYKSFCENLVAEGKMLPKHVDMHCDNMELRYQTDAKSFSDKSQEATSVNAYKALLSDSDKIVDYTETATKDKAGDKKENDFDAAVKKLVGEGKSYSEAYNLAANQNPDLYAEYITQ